MFTMKNMLAAGLLVFGSTFLWMTKMFLADARSADGAIWGVIQILVLAAIAGFTVAAFGVYRGATWWEPVAMVSAVIGLVSVVPYVIGVRAVGQFADAGVGMNIAIHVVGSVVVIALVMVPVIHTWLSNRL
jgi:hypothetical protein